MDRGVPFVSPPELEVTVNLPNRGTIVGMGIRAGVTLIIGGGYHGKSTLLHALEVAVYPHIAGDGREYVATDATAFKLRAEDGRSVKATDISMFIRNLPNGRETKRFESEDASGSTSQAANAIEAIEAGTRLFLVDEDTSASNFMVRDELMQRVVYWDKEPITPFIERVSELYEKMGISSVIVAGSSGAFFHVADVIVQMDNYRAKDVTVLAKREAEAFPLPQTQALPFAVPDFAQRRPRTAGGGGGWRGGRGGKSKARARGTDNVSVNHEDVEVKYLEQLIDPEQAVTLAQLLATAETTMFDGRRTMREVVDALYDTLWEKGIGSASDEYRRADMAMPRKQEIFGCFNRCRSLNI
jgi:predicted ABC-class ATPase